jgi:hypothetical protein
MSERCRAVHLDALGDLGYNISLETIQAILWKILDQHREHGMTKMLHPQIQSTIACVDKRGSATAWEDFGGCSFPRGLLSTRLVTV